MSEERKKDPHYKREAEKYETPIPSREFILSELAEFGRPATLQEIYELLAIDDPTQQEALTYRIKAMLRDGQLMRDRRKRYCLVGKIDLLSGVVIGHPDGYGFVQLDVKADDIYLTPKQMRLVFPGDRVLVTVNGRDRRGRREGIIQEVLERKSSEIVGRFYQTQGIAYITPENKRINNDIYIIAGQTLAAQTGQIVVVKIQSYPTMTTPAMGEVIQILGDHMAPGMEIDIAIRDYQLPEKWSDALLTELKQISIALPQDEIQKRNDCRDLPFVTIDGEDAQDFDDAVYCKPLKKGGWLLYVAIADVSHYVELGTLLDDEAKNRGTSVYFPGRVIPMLPELLSNELCSLKPEVDRFAFVCEMAVSAKGRVTRSRFYKATIRSKARLTYQLVNNLLVEKDERLIRDYQPYVEPLTDLYALFKVLYHCRQARGAIEFETVETQIIFDSNRKIEKIIPRVRNDAHRLIEECMLLANVCAARLIEQHGYPSLYRVHAAPNEDRVADLRSFLSELGLQLKGGRNPKPSHYASLLREIQDRPDKHIIQTVLLRSQSQAVYSPENAGHFGLAYEAYAHFTSPIRRYPDLLLHRAIAHVLTYDAPDKFIYDMLAMERLGLHCSMTERRADEATRDVVDWLKCEFLLEKEGESADGIIVSVTHFGLFVALKEIYVEGLVHITALTNDYYHFDAVKHRLRGERTGKTYRLGDPIRVQVARVSLDERKIDFVLA